MSEIVLHKFDLNAPGAFQRIVNHMTNHERNQWARMEYPGLKKKDALLLSRLSIAAAAMRRITGYVTTLGDPLRFEP